MSERWRKVRRAPGYKVSSLGRVRSVDRTLPSGQRAGGVVLTPWADSDGYLRVTIAGESVPVHHLVLEAFRGPRPYGMQGCHGPGGRQDNRAEVLRWDTKRENERDKKRTGGLEERAGGTRPKDGATSETGRQQR